MVRKQEEYVRKAIVSKFFNPLKCSFGGQTADAMALELGLFPEDRRQEATQAIMYDINTGHKFLDVGVFGLSRIGSELSRNGASAQAFGLFTKKGENSFGVMVDSLKVTTLWRSCLSRVTSMRSPTDHTTILCRVVTSPGFLRMSPD